MSRTSRVLLVAAMAFSALATTGCADLTRPDEITIIAEAPPAPKAPPVPAAAIAEADGASESGTARKPGKKAGG